LFRSYAVHASMTFLYGVTIYNCCLQHACLPFHQVGYNIRAVVQQMNRCHVSGSAHLLNSFKLSETQLNLLNSWKLIYINWVFFWSITRMQDGGRWDRCYTPSTALYIPIIRGGLAVIARMSAAGWIICLYRPWPCIRPRSALAIGLHPLYSMNRIYTYTELRCSPLQIIINNLHQCWRVQLVISHLHIIRNNTFITQSFAHLCFTVFDTFICLKPCVYRTGKTQAKKSVN